MEMTMRKSNDTTTRELTEAELAAVSGGYTLQNTMVSSFYAAAGGSVGDGTGSGSGSAGWDLTKNKAC